MQTSLKKNIFVEKGQSGGVERPTTVDSFLHEGDNQYAAEKSCSGLFTGQSLETDSISASDLANKRVGSSSVADALGSVVAGNICDPSQLLQSLLNKGVDITQAVGLVGQFYSCNKARYEALLGPEPSDSESDSDMGSSCETESEAVSTVSRSERRRRRREIYKAQCDAMPDVEGFCYLSLIKWSRRAWIKRRFGENPKIYDLLSGLTADDYDWPAASALSLRCVAPKYGGSLFHLHPEMLAEDFNIVDAAASLERFFGKRLFDMPGDAGERDRREKVSDRLLCCVADRLGGKIDKRVGFDIGENLTSGETIERRATPSPELSWRDSGLNTFTDLADNYVVVGEVDDGLLRQGLREALDQRRAHSVLSALGGTDELCDVTMLDGLRKLIVRNGDRVMLAAGTFAWTREGFRCGSEDKVVPVYLRETVVLYLSDADGEDCRGLSYRVDKDKKPPPLHKYYERFCTGASYIVASVASNQPQMNYDSITYDGLVTSPDVEESVEWHSLDMRAERRTMLLPDHECFLVIVNAFRCAGAAEFTFGGVLRCQGDVLGKRKGPVAMALGARNLMQVRTLQGPSFVQWVSLSPERLPVVKSKTGCGFRRI